MKSYKEIIAEIEGFKMKDVLSKKNVIVAEQEIFRKLVEFHGKCERCQRTERLSLDHVIPKDVLRSLGVDPERELIEGNYMLLCKICNSFKSNKLDFSIPATKIILLDLISKL